MDERTKPRPSQCHSRATSDTRAVRIHTRLRRDIRLKR
jgi:hypothetical protein